MRFLVCLDGTEFSHSIIPVAKKFALATNAEVEILRVIPPERHGGEPWSGETEASATQTSREIAMQELAPLASEFNPPASSIVVMSNTPAEAIVRHARSTLPDAILLATHSRGLLAETALGSTARDVTRAGVAPVLLLHPRELRSMNPADIPVGVHVFTADREPLGAVLEISHEMLHIRRNDGSSVRLPASTAETISGSYLLLNLTAAEVEREAVAAGPTGG